MDNIQLDSGTGGVKVAGDELTYSGDTSVVTLGRLVHVTGSEGAKTLHEVFFAEDAAHATGDFGIQLLAVRSDTLAALAGSTGDYTPMQVNALGALYTVLTAGTAEIGKLAAGSATIGEVTIGVATTAATDLAKAVSAVHATADVGIMGLAVRNDVLADLAGSDGDYTPLQVDELGAVYGNQGNRISADGVNSRAKSTLLAAGEFQGVGEDVSKYGRVGVSIVSDNKTDGVLTMEVSRNVGGPWGGPTRTWADTRFAQPHMWNIVEKYFRIKYVNGTTEATNLQIQVQYSNNANILLGHQLNETLLDETEAIIVRSVAVGQDPNDVYLNSEQSGVDNDNSSIVNLTSGTSLIFTGTWHNVSGYAGITVLIDGTTGGGAVSGTLELQFSHDGVTVHRNISTTTTDVRDTLPRTLGVVAKYFRIVYTSDADTVSFQAQTMYHVTQVQLVSRADGTLQGSEDVTNVRSIIVGYTGSAFVNVKASPGGALKIDTDEIGGNSVSVGAGTVGTGTQRMTLGSDDPAVVALQLIDNAVSGAGFNITQLAGAAVPIGAGVESTALRVTLATDSTGVVSIDDNGGSITVDGTVAVTGVATASNQSTIITAVQIIDNAIFVDNAPFTLTTSSVMVSGAIRDDTLSALSAVENDAVPLRVNSSGALHVTGGGGGTQYSVDDAGPTVVTMAGVVRDDTLTTLTEVDGDATLLRVNSTGALHITGGGGGTEYTQDAIHTDPATAATWLMARDDVLATQETLDGDWTLPRANARGAQWVELDLTNDVTIADGGNSITVDWNGTTPPIGAGTEAAALRVTLATDSTGVLSIDDNGASLTVDNAGLTKLDAAINTSRLDVNIAASGATVTVTAAGITDLDAAINVLGTDSYLEATSKGITIAAVRNDTLAALANVDNELAPLQVNALGALYVDGSGVTQPVSGTVTANPASGTIDTLTNLVQMNGVAISLNTGTVGTGTQRVTLASNDASVTSLALIDDGIITADDVAGTATGMMAMAQRDDEVGSTATTTADGDAAALTVNKFSQLKTTGIADATSEIKYKAINAASGDNEIVALVSSTKIRVLSVMLIAGGTTDARFESNAAGAALTGIMKLVANSGFTLPFNPGGWFESVSGQSISLECTGDIDGMLSYVEV